MKFGLDQLVKAFELSFDLKKINVQLVGILAGIVLFFLFSFIGSLIQQSFLIILFAVLAIASAYIACVVACGSVCRMIFRDVVSGEKLSLGAAFKFGWEKMWTLVLSPIGLAVMLAIIGLIEYILFLAGRIPVVGQILLALIIIPLLITNVMIVLIAFFGALLIPSIIAVEESSIGETLSIVYKAAKKAPTMLLIYLAVACVILFAVVGWTAIAIAGGGLVTSMVLSEVIQNISNVISGGSGISIPLWITITIAALSLTVIAAYLISYLLVLVNTVHTSIYLAVKDKLS